MKKNIKRVICFALCMIMCLGALTSCATVPFRKAKKDDDKLVEKFEDANYNVESISGSWLDYIEETIEEEYGVQGVKAIVMAVPEESESNEEAGIFFYCEKSSDAIKSKAGLKDYVKENQDDTDVELIVKRSGKMVYVGTRSVWRTAKAITFGDVLLGAFVAFALIFAVIGFVVIVAVVIILIAGGGIGAVAAVIGKKKKNKKLAAAVEVAPTEQAPAEETAE